MSNNNAMKKTSFYELLKNNKFVVPEIQREYVWGNEKYILDNFFKSIEENHTYNIGFLYSYKPNYSREDDEIVYLIDGQQRFTTLYLAFFYFTLKKNQKDDEYEELMDNFSYRVRTSTAEFISNLKYKVNNIEDLVNIENSTWYLMHYRNDLSIQNMLKLFEYLGTYKEKDDDMYEKIKKVEFWNFNIGETVQGEELYITMNSRGEAISNNENIRAYLLEKEKEEDKKKYGIIFDNWQEFFWKHRAKDKNADEGFNAFLSLVVIIERYKKKASGDSKETEELTYSKNSFKEITSGLYQHAKDIDLEFNAIERYFDTLKTLVGKIEDENFDIKGIAKLLTEKNNNEKNNFDKYLQGDIDMRGYTFMLPLLVICDLEEIKDDDTKLKRWIRFFYNIAFNRKSEAVKTMLGIACKVLNNNVIDTIDMLENEEITKQPNYDDDEEDKIKLEVLKKNKEKREELEKIFIELEDHVIIAGYIQHFIKKSSVNDNIDIEKLKIYKNKFFDLFKSESKSYRDILRRALLSINKCSHPIEIFVRDGFSIHQPRFHFNNGEWASYFKKENERYFKLMDNLLNEKNELVDIINGFNDKDNCFYIIIKNANVLEFSKKKRFTFDNYTKTIGYILEGRDAKGNYRPIGYYKIEMLLEKKFKNNKIEIKILDKTFELEYKDKNKDLKYILWINEDKFDDRLKGFELDLDKNRYCKNIDDADAVLETIETIKNILK